MHVAICFTLFIAFEVGASKWLMIFRYALSVMPGNPEFMGNRTHM